MAKITNRPDRDVLRRIDRLVNFSDGVLAIAVTLLVLPLADRVSSGEFSSFEAFFNALWEPFLLFSISFAVICRFWLVHHNIFQSLKRFNVTIFALNCGWLFTIVLIPFFTELFGGRISSSGGVISGLYIFNIFLLSLIGVLIQFEIKRRPELRLADAQSPLLAGGVAAVILIFIACAATVLFAVPYPWLLLLLFLSGPTQKMVQSFEKSL